MPLPVRSGTKGFSSRRQSCLAIRQAWWLTQSIGQNTTSARPISRSAPGCLPLRRRRGAAAATGAFRHDDADAAAGCSAHRHRAGSARRSRRPAAPPMPSRRPARAIRCRRPEGRAGGQRRVVGLHLAETARAASTRRSSRPGSGPARRPEGRRSRAALATRRASSSRVSASSVSNAAIRLSRSAIVSCAWRRRRTSRSASCSARRSASQSALALPR